VGQNRHLRDMELKCTSTPTHTTTLNKPDKAHFELETARSLYLLYSILGLSAIPQRCSNSSSHSSTVSVWYWWNMAGGSVLIFQTGARSGSFSSFANLSFASANRAWIEEKHNPTLDLTNGHRTIKTEGITYHFLLVGGRDLHLSACDESIHVRHT